MTQISDAKIGVAGTAHIEGGMHIYGTDKPRHMPLHLPPRPEHFTNRKAELEKLLADLRPGHTVTLCGPGGMGKSALAAEAVWQLTSGTAPPAGFPDGVIWHDFYREPKAETALEHIARCFGEEPVPSAFIAAQKALSGRKAVLLLDGTEDTDNLPAVLSVRGNCGVIVTSRRHKDAEEKWEDIRPLEADEAIRLLRAWGGDQAKEENAARQICQMLGGLSLAVRLAGRYVSQTGDSAAEYLEWLKTAPFEALDPDKEQHRLESVTWLIEHSLKQVEETARQILAVCGILAFAPFSRQVMVAALENETAVRRGLNTLVNYGLLIRREERWQVSHALIHTYARTRLRVPEEMEKNLVLYYLAFAAVQKERMAQGFAALNPEKPHILSLLHSTSDAANALNLLWAMREYCYYQGHYAEFRADVLHCTCAAQKMGDPHQEANCIQSLGDVHIRLSEYEQARKCYEEARPVYAQIGDRHSLAATLAYLGLTYKGLGEMETAREHLQQSVDLFEKIKSPAAATVKKWLADL